MRRVGSKLCPPLRFECGASERGADCTAFNDAGAKIGSIEVRRESEDDNIASVVFVQVTARRIDEQRCGVGTRLYEKMFEEACTRGWRLASDTQRTRFSERFWKKQVEKGRAECVVKKGRRSRGGAQLNDEFVATGRQWQCRQYAMKDCPTKIDLSGATKRIDWRGEPVKRKRRRKP